MSLFDIPVVKNNGQETTLAEYKGKVIVVVNVASKCGLTPHYAGLEALYQKHKDNGLVILAFPSNEFKGQEPGTDEEILDFCQTKYNVTFPLFKKLSLLGDDKHPLYKALIAAQPVTQDRQAWADKLAGFGIETTKEPEVLWNFEKFVISKDGSEVQRFSPATPAEALEPVVEKLLQ